jgi:hypothetical protein
MNAMKAWQRDSRDIASALESYDGAEDQKSTSRDKQPTLKSNTKGLLTKRILRGTSCPHSKNMSGVEDSKDHFEGQDSPHSKNMSGVEDRKSTWRDKQPALEEYERC